MGIVLIRAISWFARLLTTALVIRAIMSWFVRDPYTTAGKIYMAVIKFTEPFVAPCRRLLERIGLNQGMFDFSVLAAFFMIELAAGLLMNLVAIILL